jgi:hypothetical protein
MSVIAKRSPLSSNTSIGLAKGAELTEIAPRLRLGFRGRSQWIERGGAVRLRESAPFMPRKVYGLTGPFRCRCPVSTAGAGREKTLDASDILAAAGRTRNTDRLDAAEGNVRLDSHGYMQVDDGRGSDSCARLHVVHGAAGCDLYPSNHGRRARRPVHESSRRPSIQIALLGTGSLLTLFEARPDRGRLHRHRVAL